MDTCKLSVYLGVGLCVFIVFFINYLNFLNPVIIERPRITIWSITHFITFYFAGKLCPNQYLKYFIMGVLWEIFEKIYGIMTNKELYWTSNGVEGQLNDIIINTFGYHFAHIL